MSLAHQGSWAPVAQAVKQISDHPLCPLTASEIERAGAAVKGIYSGSPEIQFKVITLEEPEKALLVPFLDAEHAGSKLPKLERRAFVSYYLRNAVRDVVDETFVPDF